MNNENNYNLSACLSWKKSDFEKNNIEVPDKLLKDETHSEGELMSENEIIEWILDTQKVFSVIKEQDEKRFNELYQGFLQDLEYLVSINKIDADSVDEILRPENFEF